MGKETGNEAHEKESKSEGSKTLTNEAHFPSLSLSSQLHIKLAVAAGGLADLHFKMSDVGFQNSGSFQGD